MPLPNTVVSVPIGEVREWMSAGCERLSVPEEDIPTIVDHYLDAEVRRKTTHGVGKFVFESQFFPEREAKPVSVMDTGPLVKLDGRKEIGPVAAAISTDLVMERATEFGVATVGINNMQRYGILGTWAERMSNNGFLGIVMNTCEPAMAGYGSAEKQLGTNPISYAIPQRDRTHTVDMSSSTSAMSLIWDRMANGQDLPPNEFYDAQGNFTQDPHQATAVRCFGGIKGFGVALLVQTMTGPLFGFKSGSDIKSFYDAGYVFMAFDPRATSSYDQYVDSNTRLIGELEASGAIIPGSRSLAYVMGEDSTLNLNEKVISDLRTMAGQK